MKKIMLVAVLAGLVSTQAAGQDRLSRVEARQLMQQLRLREVCSMASLSRREGVKLRAEQRHIRRAERRAKVYGKTSLYELRRLQKMQFRAHRDFWRLKHNRHSRLE